MKNKLFFLLCFLYLGTLVPQKITLTGVWQVDNSELAAGLKDVYRFYKDNKFQFDFSGFNYNRKLISLYGKYTIDDENINFKVEKIKIVANCEIGTYEADYQGWAYEKGKYIIKKLKEVKEKKATFSIVKDKNIISIEGIKFYKISDNPDEYKE